MNNFANSWADAAETSVGFFWTALWAFALGYLISSLIQVLVTRERMQEAMGESGPKSVALGTFFGFISSSCSFAALSTTRALFQKGAGLVPAMAFMLASTNLVIELGIVIAIFLGWQFVVGEYVGGFLLIGFAWLFIEATRPDKLIKEARDRLGSAEEHHESGDGDWKERMAAEETWQKIGATYVMEWQMVWKDVLIGFTVAGIIAAFVPDAFFHALFLGSGGEEAANPGFLRVVTQVLVGPLAAFFTFIGSMGNIPLAALLFDHGVSFAGVMAFIFSDLVVLPVLRINAEYYGWKMSLYILGVLLACLVATSLLLHYGLLAVGVLPDGSGRAGVEGGSAFQLNYGFMLNMVAIGMSAVLGRLWWKRRSGHEHDHGGSRTSWSDWILRVLSIAALAWVAGGLVMKFGFLAGG